MAQPIKKQVWSNIDVAGLMNGISIWDEQYKNLKYVRRPFDSTVDIRNKIYDLHDHPVGVDAQGILNGLSIEFGYDPYNVINKHIFLLQNEPVPSGNANIQDVNVFYRPSGSITWTELTPQNWTPSTSGFIVWQNERYNNLPNIKNFTYTNILEIFSELPDNTELKVKYKRTIEDKDGSKIVDFTDINTSNENRLTYRTRVVNNITDSISVYTLNSIPTGLYNLYFDSENGTATNFLYRLGEYINKKFKHRWGEFSDSSCIWDVHKYYGSGQIPSFYDAYASNLSSGYVGGVESMSTALYPSEIVETDYTAQTWNLKVYPGRFYISGIPFYFFENPQVTNLSFVNGSSVIPSGLERGMYTIMSLSGYYSGTQDISLNGHVFEDYIYPTGASGLLATSNVYRKRPFLNSINSEISISLMSGEYNIDYTNNVIYSSGVNNATLVWDKVKEPSGYIIPYNINPLNLQSNNVGGYFLYMNI